MKIGDICTKICSGGTPTSSIKEYYNGNIPWLNTKEVCFNRVYNTEKKITQLGYESSAAKLIPSNSVIVAMYGATAAKCCINKIPLTTNQACCNLIIDEAKGDYNFIYYYICYKYNELLSLTNGAAQQNLNTQIIKDFEIPSLSLEKQKTIAAVLSALDDKIEVNRAINKNLEATAQAIFKSWFVDFEPFGGVMPADWSLCSLDECCSLIARGITPKYDDQSVDFVINQKCIRNHSLDLKLSRKHNSKVPENKNLHYGDILINSTGQGTLGRTAQVIFTPNNLTVDSHITIVRPKYDLLIEYLGYLITSKEDDFVAMEQGSTGQTELPRERVKSYSIILPSEEKLDAFQKITKPILKKMYINQVENQRLAAIRDALLPKLMSGKIDVSQVKI